MAKTSITAKLGLDTTAFQRGMAKSQKGVNNFVKNGIAKFGALAGAAGLGAMARSAIDLGSKISDMALQLNVGTTELQVLDFAAREAGVGTEIMARALRNVQLRTEEAIKGNKSYGDAFKQLGINVEEFKQLKTEEKLEAIAVAQANATDKGAAYNAVARILGEKAGPALQEVLQNLAGPKGYGGLAAAAERAGEVMDKATIQKMDDAADGIESFKRRATVATATVIGWTKSMTDWAGATAAGLVELAQGRNVWSQYEESVDGVLAAYDPLEDKTLQAAKAQGKLALATDMSTQFFYDQIEAVDTLRERLDAQAKKETEIANKKFIKAKRLEELQLRAAGKNAEADALKKQIELTEEAMKIAKEYGITLANAAKLVQGIQNNKTSGGSTPAAKKTTIKRLDPNSFRAREIAAGLHNTTLGRDGRRLDAMVDKPAKVNPVEVTQKQATDYLKTIAQELTTTTR